MNWLDIVFVIVLVGSVLDGLKQGLARTSIGLVAFFVGLFGGLWYYDRVAAHLSFSRPVANVVGFFVIFVGVMVLGGILGALIARLLKVVRLSWLDRLMGGAFGIVRAALTCAVIVAVIMAFSAKQPPPSVADSHIAPYAIGTARIIVYAAPQEFSEAFHQSYDKVRKLWDDVTNKKPQRPDAADL